MAIDPGSQALRSAGRGCASQQDPVIGFNGERLYSVDCNGAKYSWLDGYGHASEQCPAGYRVEYMVYACKEPDGSDKL